MSSDVRVTYDIRDKDLDFDFKNVYIWLDHPVFVPVVSPRGAVWDGAHITLTPGPERMTTAP